MVEQISAGSSLAHWRLRLTKSHPHLAEQLFEKPDPYKTLRDMGLPTHPYLFFESISPFLANAAEHMQSLRAQGVERFFINMRPKDQTKEKYRKLDLSPQQALEFVQSVPPSDRDQFGLTVSKFEKAAYGGVMIINPSGQQLLELVKGEMSELATGKKTPEYTVTRDKFTQLFRYSFNDKYLVDGVVAALSVIPRKMENTSDSEISIRGVKFQPGYYEFTLMERAGNLQPIFFDYNDNPVFYLPEPQKDQVI